jgi:F-type H+-transporting ATPase subunit c
MAAKMIASGLCVIGLVGPGAGAGIVFNGLLRGAAQNPFMKNQLFVWAILGFALTEALALFALMMAFLMLFAF